MVYLDIVSKNWICNLNIRISAFKNKIQKKIKFKYQRVITEYNKPDHEANMERL